MTPDRDPQPEAARPNRRLRAAHFVYAALAMAIPVIAIFGLAIWYASTPQFAARVHKTVVSTLENATGGKVEMRSFQWSARHMTIHVDDLTIHGKEAAGLVPYFHVDHLTLNAKIVSFFTPKIALAGLTAERPVFHLILYPNGTTNQPEPRAPSHQPLQSALLDLAIDRTRVENGLVLLNDRAIPWEMAAGPLQLTMHYNGSSAGYAASLETKNITFQLKHAVEAHSQLKAELQLSSGRFAVHSLDLKTGGSQLSATGQLQDFSHPRWQMSVRGSVDAREVGAITGEDELRNGTAQLDIHAHGEPGRNARENFQVAGHLDLRAAEWESSWLRLRNVGLHTDLIVDNDQCSLTGFSSVLEDGGRISGSLILRHCVGPSKPVVSPAVWRAGQPPPRQSWRAKLSPRELLRRLHRKSTPGTVNLEAPIYQPLQAEMDAQVVNVTLPLVLGAVAPKQYWNIGFTTATSGEVTARWTGDGDGLDVHGNLTMHAPQRTLGLVPVSGSAHADYLGDHRHLVIEQADENTPATKVHAAGTLTLLTNDPNSNLRLDTVGTNLGEFDRLLTVLDLRVTPKGEAHTLPLNLLGPVGFHGFVHGSFFALEAAGHLDSQRFQMIVARSAPPGSHDTAAPVEHLLTWDAFHGDLVYAPSHLTVQNAELIRGNSVIHSSFELLPDRTAPATRTDPASYTYDKHTRINATMYTDKGSVSDLQSVLGRGWPASGELTVSAHFSGMANDLQGAGHLALRNGIINGVAIPTASMQVAAQENDLEATDIQIAAAGGMAVGKLAYNYETGALHGELTGRHFELQQVAALETKHLPVGGTLAFHIQAAGTSESPISTAALEIQGLTLSGDPMGTLHAEAHLQNGTLSLTSRADLLDTHVDAGGSVQLSGAYLAQAQLTFSRFNIAPVLRLVTNSGIEGTSSIEGRITMSGPLKRLSAIRADADIDAFNITLANRPIHSAGPLKMSLRDGKLQLKQIHLLGENADLLADGTIDLLNGNRLRLHSEGAIDAALVSVFYPNIQSSGEVRFVVNARGTAQQPDLRGSAQVSHVNLHIMNITNGLTNLNGDMAFDQDRLVVRQLTGSSGGGALDVKGFVGYRHGLFVDLTATAKDVRVRYPKGISSSTDARLRLLGASDNLQISGNMVLVRFGVGSSFDLSSLAAGGGGVSAPVDPSSPLNRVRLDIHLTSAPQVGFQNSFASLAGEVNLRIRGTLENPSVLGRVDISEGSASFAGTKYRLQQGDIVFNNPVAISPQIDLVASARVQNYDIIISLHGPPSKLEISYRSEPPLTQADVLALLALGRTNEQATMYGEQQQANANLTSEALLGGALNAAVSSRVQKLFGVGSVRVDPNFVGTLGESTARVTVEEQVGRSLTLTFATNVNTTAQQLIQAQYDLTRTVSIIAVRDEADVFSMYLQIRAKHK